MKKILIALVLISNVIVAQDNIATDRPGATYSALTVPKKSFQLETGVLSQIQAKTLSLPEYMIRLGVLNFLEIRMENSFYKFNSTYNSSAILLGVKVQLLKSDKFKLGFLSTVNLSENDRSDLSFTERLLFAYTINDNSDISGNIGIDNVSIDNNGSLIYTLSYGRSFTDKLGLYLETYGDFTENALTDKTDFNSYINIGGGYLLNNKLQLDAKFGVDVNNFDNYFIGVGISFRAFN